jgi:hypothetical protein
MGFSLIGMHGIAAFARLPRPFFSISVGCYRRVLLLHLAHSSASRN